MSRQPVCWYGLTRDTVSQMAVVAAFASRAIGQGHTCLPLSVLPGWLAEAGVDREPYRDPATLRRHLLASPVIGRPGDIRPLILDAHDNLFLFRLHCNEEAIAQAVRQRAAGIEDVSAPLVRPLIDELFPASTPAIDWQRTAAALALCKRFVVISGGPGTGKTYTVARILALLTAVSAAKPRIALAAPTGKAALRLQESIHSAKTTLPHHLAESIPDQAQTLHRLLGFQSSRPGFLHNAANPLHLDLLILDEASMIDVPLMAATLAALSPSCRVLLLGDRDQLASVEAGNLFGDLCGDGALRWSGRLIEQMQPLVGQDHIPAPCLDASDPLADSWSCSTPAAGFGPDPASTPCPRPSTAVIRKFWQKFWLRTHRISTAWMERVQHSRPGSEHSWRRCSCRCSTPILPRQRCRNSTAAASSAPCAKDRPGSRASTGWRKRSSGAWAGFPPRNASIEACRS
jgi:exodeoxyribonuclease V alpha subunit